MSDNICLCQINLKEKSLTEIWQEKFDPECTDKLNAKSGSKDTEKLKFYLLSSMFLIRVMEIYNLNWLSSFMQNK